MGEPPRLGKRTYGLTVVDDAPLAPALQQVIDEVRAAAPGRIIDQVLRLDAPVAVDPARIAQLASNLLANAIQHGAKEKPVRLEAHATSTRFTLAVVNHGIPIPPDRINTIFLPFFRGVENAQSKGLGLGLYIAAEIARAHGGALEVSSSTEETRFIFTMPQG
jgi:sigma-B regulation protein RsbU (phosphoserine phosphatase)